MQHSKSQGQGNVLNLIQKCPSEVLEVPWGLSHWSFYWIHSFSLEGTGDFAVNKTTPSAENS